ncbi:MAG: YdiU family protein [Pseudanabaenaceae cyanobacterium bins.39]|nr:YdiU family protein [Pseudanabaenaceae cyanobacterium bins.39]
MSATSHPAESSSTNPFLQLPYEPAIESQADYHDVVTAAQFPQHRLRWRNDDLLPIIGLQPDQVSDDDFIEAFGHFQGVRPFLALRYHGYQFGEYNPQLGDGRGFIYGQVRGIDGELYDFGTKGSGRTPYSRTADGRLTLKGGVREIIASEALHRMGVKTSRCLSLIETGEELWRGDEPSPTRSSVMVRFSRSHIRFGTFERLHWHSQPDLIRKLLNHVLQIYYPHLWQTENQDSKFYLELVERVATLCAQWMVSGFCHAVLNTDNMSITGESFDYGPFAFIPNYDPRFTAAYFDYAGRYSYANQPAACYWNLEKLQIPLSMIMSKDELQSALQEFKHFYRNAYCQMMLKRLGLPHLSEPETEDLIGATLELMSLVPAVGYNQFFVNLRQCFHANWREAPQNIFAEDALLQQWQLTDEQLPVLDKWRNVYYQLLIRQPIAAMDEVSAQLQSANPTMIFLRPKIEELWEQITVDDNWQPFYEAIAQLKQ